MNFPDARVEAGKLRVQDIGEALVAVSAELPVEGTGVTLGVRPQQLIMRAGAGRHRVDLKECPGGVSYLYLMSENGTRIVVGAGEETGLNVGDRGGPEVPEVSAMLFDEATGRRLR